MRAVLAGIVALTLAACGAAGAPERPAPKGGAMGATGVTVEGRIETGIHFR